MKLTSQIKAERLWQIGCDPAIKLGPKLDMKSAAKSWVVFVKDTQRFYGNKWRTLKSGPPAMNPRKAVDELFDWIIQCPIRVTRQGETYCYRWSPEKLFFEETEDPSLQTSNGTGFYELDEMHEQPKVKFKVPKATSNGTLTIKQADPELEKLLKEEEEIEMMHLAQQKLKAAQALQLKMVASQKTLTAPDWTFKEITINESEQ
jgi:hypothetical protein